MAEGESEGDKAADQVPGSLPEEFLQFLDANGVPKEVFTGAIRQEIPRYVRVNPRGPFADLSPAERQKAISQALQTEQSAVQLVQWLRAGEVTDHRYMEVYACPASSNLSRTEAYRNGSLYGVDAASVFAVCCLQPRPKDHILDLCCAPGAKLCTLSDAVGPDGTVTGVDVAEQRLAACRTVLRKYGILNVKLSLGDGTTWRPNTAEWFSLEAPPRGRGQRGRKRRFEEKAKATAAATADTANTADRADTNETYDRVLVDAECTHDASCRHLEKFRTQWGLDSLSGRVPWIRQEGLFDLQLGLLSNGFALLKEGGYLVYATCSLCQRQNEDVVDSLLKQNPSAALSALPLPLCAANLREPSSSAPARPSLLEAGGPKGGGQYCTARFDPVTSGTSGLFIARLQKLKAVEQISKAESPGPAVAPHCR